MYRLSWPDDFHPQLHDKHEISFKLPDGGTHPWPDFQPETVERLLLFDVVKGVVRHVELEALEVFGVDVVQNLQVALLVEQNVFDVLDGDGGGSKTVGTVIVWRQNQFVVSIQTLEDTFRY